MEVEIQLWKLLIVNNKLGSEVKIWINDKCGIIIYYYLFSKVCQDYKDVFIMAEK